MNQEDFMNKPTVTLGSLYRDKITGFSGVAVSATRYLWGCERVVLQPPACHEGKPVESQVFDIFQLEDRGPWYAVLSSGSTSVTGPDSVGDPGGPGDVPSPRVVAKR